MRHAALVRVAAVFFFAALASASLGFTGLLGSGSLLAELLSFALLGLSTLTLGLELFVPSPPAGDQHRRPA